MVTWPLLLTVLVFIFTFDSKVKIAGFTLDFQQMRSEALHQFRVFRFGLAVDGDVGVGGFPESEEALISG